jgi:hypothetical protein
MPSAATSIWKQQGVTIVGDANYAKLGQSVALSADASTMVIGASDYNNDTGYIKVFFDDDGGNRLGQTIYGDATIDLFGFSVDVTPDGMTIICGSPGKNSVNDRPGYVRVFSLEGDDNLNTDTWNQIGQDIIGEAEGDQFGESVSISEDGMTIAVGANRNDGNDGSNPGHVRIYRLIYRLADKSTSWVQIGQDIDGEAAGDRSGWSVSLSADGSTVAIGAPLNDNNGDNSGQVTVYQIDSGGSSWERLGQTIYGDNAEDWLGLSVNLSPNAITLAIGSPGNYEYNDRPGYVRVFSLASDNILGTDIWNQIGQDIIGEADGDEFGRSVFLSDDGKTITVGAPYANGENGEDSGRVSVYRMDDSESGWIQLGNDIDGEAGGDRSGWSISLSADGRQVAIGSPYNDDNGDASGHARVFVFG